MLSFYGGQPGINFEIKKVFSNKVELVEDLKKGWSSTIGVGDYVVISYGLPNEVLSSTPTDIAKYEENKQIDFAAYGKTYNSTFWQKLYVDDDNRQEIEKKYGKEAIFLDSKFEKYGFAYFLIAAMTGETPVINFSSENHIINADQEPRAEIEVGENQSERVVKFYVPASLAFNQPTTTVVAPNVQPQIQLKPNTGEKGEEINLGFTLPRAAHFYFGDEVNDELDNLLSTYGDAYLANIGVGDYYISTLTGAIFEVLEDSFLGNDKEKIVGYRGNIVPKPPLETEIITPFTDTSGTLSEPSIAVDASGLKLQMPAQIKSLVEYQGVGSLDTGGIQTSYLSDKESVKHTFSIPQGSKWFVGDNIGSAIAKNGDYFLYTSGIEHGNIYQKVNNQWISTGQQLRGRDGSSLNIIDTYAFTTADGEDTVENISTKFVRQPAGIGSGELIAASYDDGTKITSYWYFQVGGVWNRAILTSGLGNLIVSNESADFDDKVYSTSYINKALSWGRFTDLF